MLPGALHDGAPLARGVSGIGDPLVRVVSGIGDPMARGVSGIGAPWHGSGHGCPQ